MSENRWLTKEQYNKIRNKAKKIGADKCNFKYIWHKVHFGKVCVAFMFNPLIYHFSVQCDTQQNWRESLVEADKLKIDISNAQKFIEYLKENYSDVVLAVENETSK
jgi:hypothetical protein